MDEATTSVHPIDSNMLNNLKKLVDETGAKIILSSSWHSYFNEYNGVVSVKVYEGKPSKGGTVLANALDSVNLKIHRLVSAIAYDRTPRGELISNFLKSNPALSYVIIDDESHNFTQEQKEVWIENKYASSDYKNEGLIEELTQKAIQILNKV